MTTPGTRRVIVSKVGLDGHDVGVALVSRRLMEAGMEVVYLGKRVRTEEIVAAAISEDADVVGLSCLSGGLAHFAIKVVQGLREHDAAEIPVITGGIDEPQELERMLAAGVHRHFGPGTPLPEIVCAFVSAADDPPGHAG
jgi:methylmalonyl-CoA mutase C-terminal domain/subunit